MLRAIGSCLIADGATEEFERFDVALTGQEDAGAAVVPDRARRCLAIPRLDLSQVVVAEQELDALARPAGGVAGQAGDAREVGGLIERQKQARCEDPALGARL